MQGKWENIKKEVKTKLKAERSEVFKTGGGVAKLPNYEEGENTVLELVAKNAKPLANPDDSDRLADTQLDIEGSQDSFEIKEVKPKAKPQQIQRQKKGERFRKMRTSSK